MLRQRLCQPFGDALRRVVAALVLALYVVVTLAGGALVVCQEQDGRTTLEWRGARCCTQDESPAAAGERVSARAPDADEGDCEECVDAPVASLLTSTAAPAKRIASEPAPLAAPAVDASIWTAAVGAPCAELPLPRLGAPPSPPPRLAHLRTVVLRC